MFKSLYLVFALFLLYPLAIQGVSFSNIVINEIAWMGTSKSHYDEWIVATKHLVFL